MGAAPSKQLLSGGLFGLYVGVNLSNLLLAAASQRQQTKYINSTAVALSEVIKGITSVMSIAATEKNLKTAAAVVLQTLLKDPVELAKVAIPATLYTIQNNVIYAALSHLDAVTFQITYQLKIVASLISTRLLLGGRVSRARWASIVLLTAGVILVQLSMLNGSDAQDSSEWSKNHLVGLLGVLLACGCSGLAGAVMEALLKSKEVPISKRNLQVAAVSLLLQAVHIVTNDFSKIAADGFFQGYTPVVWSMVVLDSVGGLLVSFLLKYTSNCT
mmetsp:Transcript_31645/g.78842  ORF Transcript_31645/g.78842 Transcript_31645/m.78842 type:complete len:273 (-) Transcript_31645:466-1284(-)